MNIDVHNHKKETLKSFKFIVTVHIQQIGSEKPNVNNERAKVRRVAESLGFEHIDTGLYAMPHGALDAYWELREKFAQLEKQFPYIRIEVGLIAPSAS